MIFIFLEGGAEFVDSNKRTNFRTLMPENLGPFSAFKRKFLVLVCQWPTWMVKYPDGKTKLFLNHEAGFLERYLGVKKAMKH